MNGPTGDRQVHLLRGGGVAVALAEVPGTLPEVLHWGPDLGDLDAADLDALALASVPPVPRSALDQPWPLTLLPGEADGWSGHPGLQAHRDGAVVHPRWRETAVQADGLGRLLVRAADRAAGLGLLCELHLDGHGVLTLRHTITNDGPRTLDVVGLVATMPLPAQAEEVLDLTGRWCRERHPQWHAMQQGSWVRESRRGRTGHDATLLMVAGEAGFGFATGEVRALHLAWSGDHVARVDRLPEGAGVHAAALAGGDLLRAGEVRLEPGEAYSTPDVLFVTSPDGLDGLSDRLHEHVRARPGHPGTPRPVTLNTWEAVYFDHDMERLGALVDTAAGLGVERVVLDDGWFRGRRDDSAGLGDWEVDAVVWPDGLHPFIDRVRAAGMQVGIWVEPEMVNADSDLVREHPDWFLAPAGGTRDWRRQQVLDLTRAAAWQHILERLDVLVTQYRPEYLKWDHNRDLHEAVRADGSAAVRAQTLATYRLLDELRARHPGLEAESCSSGGARVDLGILARADRVWASDTNDPLERQVIQRWTGLLLPPELVGSHVGPPESHTTGRTTSLAFRCLTALFGHAGIEWDVTACSPEEQDQLRAWVALHKRLRPLLHGGRTVRGRERDGGLVHGVVSADATHAVHAWVRLASGADAVPGRVRLRGLDATRRYRVLAVDVLGRPEAPAGSHAGARAPAWTARPDGVVLPGAVLTDVGVQLPVLHPAEGLLLETTEVRP